MDDARTGLVKAVNCLPSAISRPLEIALHGGWFQIGAGSWEGGPGGAVCPIVAAAMTAGGWRDGHCADGGPAWGSEGGPSEAVMEFAVCFDLYAKQAGVEAVVAFTRTALAGHRRATTDEADWRPKLRDRSARAERSPAPRTEPGGRAKLAAAEQAERVDGRVDPPLRALRVGQDHRHTVVDRPRERVALRRSRSRSWTRPRRPEASTGSTAPRS